MQVSESTYYDDKCLQCEMCAHYGQGQYRDGTLFESCREFGYILHTDRPIVVDVACTRYLPTGMAEGQKERSRAQSLRDIESRQRKKR